MNPQRRLLQGLCDLIDVIVAGTWGYMTIESWRPWKRHLRESKGKFGFWDKQGQVYQYHDNNKSYYVFLANTQFQQAHYSIYSTQSGSMNYYQYKREKDYIDLVRLVSV